MEHRDAEVSDITVVLKRECSDGKLDATVAALKELGMQVEDTLPEHGVVEGTVGADKLEGIRKSPCVDYVRVEFTYVADYPVGDSRNQDPQDTADQDSED